jgi:hypothetical protein
VLCLVGHVVGLVLDARRLLTSVLGDFRRCVLGVLGDVARRALGRTEDVAGRAFQLRGLRREAIEQRLGADSGEREHAETEEESHVWSPSE